MVSFMKLANFSSNEFIDQTVLDSAETLTRDSLLDITGSLHTAGLINASALSFSYSNLTITVNAPLPFYALFSDGTLASANGTTDGSTSSSATVDFSSLVPSTGSVTAYLVAVSGSVAQEAFSVVGPPVGHPDFSPSFQPYTAYAENQDTIQFQATTTAPDNTNTLFIASTVLSAGQTTITTSSTVGQVRAGAILSQNGEVLAADLSSGAAASNVGTLGGSLVGTLPNPSLAATGAASGTYVNPVTITVDEDGRVSDIANVPNWNVPGNVTAGGSVTAASAQINGSLTATGATSLKGTTIGGLLAASSYNIADKSTGYNVTGLSIGWNFANGLGEVDLLLGPQDGAGGLNIYQLNSSGDMVSTTPILALSNSGMLTIQGQATAAAATSPTNLIPYGQAFQLLTPTASETITLGNTLETVVQPSGGITADITLTLEPGSVAGQKVICYGAGSASGSVTIQSNVTTGSPALVYPDNSVNYSWTIPTGTSVQGIILTWDGGKWRAKTFGQEVVAPATQNNAAVQLGQFSVVGGNIAGSSSATSISTSFSFTATSNGTAVGLYFAANSGSQVVTLGAPTTTVGTVTRYSGNHGNQSGVYNLGQSFLVSGITSGAAVTIGVSATIPTAEAFSIGLMVFFIPST